MTANGGVPYTGGSSGTPSNNNKPISTGGSKTGSNNKSSGSGGSVVKQTTYTDPTGKTQTGYIIDNKTYQDQAGTKRISIGSLVQAGGQNYRMTENGGVLENDEKKPQAVVTNNVNAPKQITYKGPGDVDQTGYIINGKTYKDAAGTQRIDAGSLVNSGGKTYLMGANGQGLDISGAPVTHSYELDENGQIDTDAGGRKLYNVGGTNYDALTGQRYRDIAGDNDVIVNSNGKYYMAKTGEEVGGYEVTGELPAPSEDPRINELFDMINDVVNEQIALDPTLSYEEAMARAMSQMNPQYNQAMNTAMEGINKNALQSGFFGQLPTEALKAETAGKLEVNKMQAINELASQLFGQSEESAYNKLSAATGAQQSKIANMLSMLGIYQNERGYEDDRSDTDWEKAIAEAGLTGSYKGNPTLDFLKYQKSGSGSGSGSGGGGNGGPLTKDEAFIDDLAEVDSGRVSPDTLVANRSAILEQYGYDRYNKLVNSAKKNYQYRAGNPVADFRIIAGEQ